MNKNTKIKELRDRIGGAASIPVVTLLLVKDGVLLADDAQTLASEEICEGTIVTCIKKVDAAPAHEVKQFMRKVATALNREATSLDEIADKLIAGEFETKEDLKNLDT